jgi:hypothetical protein
MRGRRRAEAIAAQATVEAGHTGFSRLRQRQADGFLAAPARPVQVAGERRTATRAGKLPRTAAAGPFLGCFRQVFIRRLMCLCDL